MTDPALTPPSAPLPLRVAVCGTRVLPSDGRWYTPHSFGRVVDLLAARVAHVEYRDAEAPASLAADFDYPFAAPNVRITLGTACANTLQAVRHPWRLLRHYWNLVGSGDVVFLRGSAPFIWAAHWMARLRGRGVVHWIVGNPVAILRGEQRGYGSLMQKLGLLFARFEQRMTRWSCRISRAHVLTNGQELAQLFAGPRTTEVVSTSITADDFRTLDDTCAGPTVRLLFVGYIRPEKGLEYLIRALPLVRSERPCQLTIVGSWSQFAGERDRLAGLASELGVAERVTWAGAAAFGRELFERIDDADLLILPSLSEGTPRVLLEARARSVPVISTRVGGIPSSVRDGVDGLLVPPRDPAALAAAISRLIQDVPLRRAVIQAGRERVRQLTLERFVDTLVQRLAAASAATGRAACAS